MKPIKSINLMLLLIPAIFFSCVDLDPVDDIRDFGMYTAVPPVRNMPQLQIVNHKNRNIRAVLAPWLRSYLDNGIAGVESLPAYKDYYIFVAKTSSRRQPVINQWMDNYNPDREASRLVAERIQSRFNRELPDISPEVFYGPHYERAIRAAYQTAFRGAQRLDDSWVFGAPAGQEPIYWGFILIGIPHNTLETQILDFFSGISGSGGISRTATREQNQAFAHVRDNFFEHF